VQAAMTGDELVLAGEGIGPMAVPVRVSRFLPCDPDVDVTDQLVTLTCVTDELPPVVNRVLGEASGRHRR
jgi:hypothetical protein